MDVDLRPSLSVRPHTGGGYAVHIAAALGQKILDANSIRKALSDLDVDTQHVRLLSVASPFRFAADDRWPNLESIDGDAIFNDGAYLPTLVETTGEYVDCGVDVVAPKLAFIAGTLLLRPRARLTALQLVQGSVGFGDGSSTECLVGIGGDARFKDARTNNISRLKFVGGTIMPMHGYMHHWADLSRFQTGMGELATVDATQRMLRWNICVVQQEHCLSTEEERAAVLIL